MVIIIGAGAVGRRGRIRRQLPRNGGTITAHRGRIGTFTIIGGGRERFLIEIKDTARLSMGIG